jgi:DNA-binding NarL/FixJ family response regulator
MATPKSILIVNHRRLVLAGLAALLRPRFPECMIHCESTFRGAFGRVSNGACDLMITDIKLPDRGGLELIRETRRVNPQTRILVVSADPALSFGCRALREGAAGYLREAVAETELFDAIQRLMDGERYVNGEMATALVDAVSGNNHRMPHETLSSRELHVMVQLASGHSIKQIAGVHGLSPKTVSTYRSRTLRKLSLHTDSDLVKYCLAHKLISPLPDVYDESTV